jgi:isopenicillin N synthase-like dioxygenase
MPTVITKTERPKVSLPLKGQQQYDYKNLTPYVHPPKTKEDLSWSKLVTLNLKDYGRLGGKERLAKQLEHAVHHVGFFYVKNYGLAQEQVDQQFTLAKNFFDLEEAEKAKYEVNYPNADYNGWRWAGRSKNGNIKDAVEVFNIPKFTKDFEGKYNYPNLLKAHLPKIEVFSRTLHSNVVLPLLRLFAIVL